MNRPVLYLCVDKLLYRLWKSYPKNEVPIHNFIGMISIDPDSTNYMADLGLQKFFPECAAIGAALGVYKSNRMTVPLDIYLQGTIGDEIEVVIGEWEKLKPHVERYLKVFQR